MNNQRKEILEFIKVANYLLEQGEIEDAVRSSGEALAIAYEDWSDNLNAGIPTDDEISIMAIAASIHCVALGAMSEFVEAYSTAMAAIFQMSHDNTRTPALDQSLLSIYTTSFYALMNILSTREPNEHDQEHVETITRYIASMVFYYYRKVGISASDSPYLEQAYEALQQMREITEIETPKINVLGELIDPKTPHALIGDLIGRSRALNLISD